MSIGVRDRIIGWLPAFRVVVGVMAALAPCTAASTLTPRAREEAVAKAARLRAPVEVAPSEPLLTVMIDCPEFGIVEPSILSDSQAKTPKAWDSTLTPLKLNAEVGPPPSTEPGSPNKTVWQEQGQACNMQFKSASLHLYVKCELHFCTPDPNPLIIHLMTS
jgi:hypothetical protein